MRMIRMITNNPECSLFIRNHLYIGTNLYIGIFKINNKYRKKAQNAMSDYTSKS